MQAGPARSDRTLEDSVSYLINRSIEDVDEDDELALPLILGESVSTSNFSMISNVGDKGYFVIDKFSDSCYKHNACDGRNSDDGWFLPEVGEGSSHFSGDFKINYSGMVFLRALQEIFVEIALYAKENLVVDDGVNSHCGNGILAFEFSNNSTISLEGHQVEAKKKRLLNLLHLVDNHYNRCLHQIHTVSSAFHTVSELDPNLHTPFIVPAISLMYKTLREKIATHILSIGALTQATRRMTGENDVEQWGIFKRDPQQLWRPQRGLPERSVSILKAWMFQNFLHPYPKDADKHLLALKSGLTRNQVSNWFINARVRLWKPMIEEMYTHLNSTNPTN